MRFIRFSSPFPCSRFNIQLLMFSISFSLLLSLTPFAEAIPDCSTVDLKTYLKLDELDGTSGYEDTCGILTPASCRSPSGCPTIGSEAKVINSQTFARSLNTGIDIPGDIYNWGVNDSFTIELWFMMPTSVGGGNYTDREVIIGRFSGDSGNGMVWWLGIENLTGNARFELGDENAAAVEDVIVLVGPKVDDGYWHHLVAIRDGVNGRNILYVDGKKVAEISVDYTAGFSDSDAPIAPVTVGWLNASPFFGFTGTADEIAIYDRVLSPAEVRAHYYLVRNNSEPEVIASYTARDYTTMCDANLPVLVMPLGDSITTGISSGVQPDQIEYWVGYRKFLWDRLILAGFKFDFVGAVTLAGEAYNDPADPTSFNPANAGYPGASTLDILDLLDTGAVPDPVDGLPAYPGAPGPYLNYFPTDVVLLHIGTNSVTHVLGGTDFADIVTDVDWTLNEIDEFSLDATAVVTRIINRNDCVGNPLHPGCVTTTTFNDDIVDIALQRSDPEFAGGYTGGLIGQKDKIIITNHETGDAVGYNPIDYRLQPDGDMYDNLHPFLPGQEKMAAIWYDALADFMPVQVVLDSGQQRCRTLPTPDIDGNDMVDGSDLVNFIDAFTTYSQPSDFNNDNLVDQLDLQVFARKFGNIW